jgi:hypothetical protein
MARDLATVGQGIEQLNASQEQMARVIAKASEQNLRPKISALPPRPTARPDAQAGADAPVAASRSAAAGRRTAVVIGAAAADARALTPFFQGEGTRSGCACQDTSFEIGLQASGR